MPMHFRVTVLPVQTQRIQAPLRQLVLLSKIVTFSSSYGCCELLRSFEWLFVVVEHTLRLGVAGRFENVYPLYLTSSCCALV